eukprot:scaffold9348_cov82-Cyclotella_meneghiniana.AAC.6
MVLILCPGKVIIGFGAFQHQNVISFDLSFILRPIGNKQVLMYTDRCVRIAVEAASYLYIVTVVVTVDGREWLPVVAMFGVHQGSLHPPISIPIPPVHPVRYPLRRNYHGRQPRWDCKPAHVLGSAQRWLPSNKAPPRSAFHRSSALPNTFHSVSSDRARTAARRACGRDSSNGGRGRGSLPSQKRRKVLPISPCGPIAMGMKH